MRRIVVVGTSGSGKSTLARELSRRMNVPHVELDALHWGPNWTEAPRDVFRRRVEQAVAGDAWVVDGNYLSVRDIVHTRADTIVWLDYSMSVVFGRVLLRSLRRAIHREELWAGNRESLRLTFCSRESILLWVINTWRQRRREFSKLFADESGRNRRLLRFRTPRESDEWLQTIGCEPFDERARLGDLVV